MLDLVLKKSVREKFLPKSSVKERQKFIDKPIKSAIKAISWRIVGTLDTMIISFILTGKIKVAVSIGGVEIISKTILYYLHERLWSRVHNFNIKRIIAKKTRGVWN